MSKKILLVATVQSHICQFHLPVMKMLQETGWEVHVAARNNLAEKKGLTMQYVDKVYDIPFNRSPLSYKNIVAYKKLKRIVDAEKYDVVQCNTPVGGVLARLSAAKHRKNGTKTVYIAHGFHFYKGAPKKNWLIYYPIEKWMAPKTDVLVTINHADYERASRMGAKQTLYVSGMGIDTRRIMQEPFDRATFRDELGIPQESVVVLSVGELNDNKNSETLLRAAAKLKNENIYFCFAGNGPLQERFVSLAEEWGITSKVRFLGYRRDVPNMCKSSDIFCLLSKREGLGLAALEAMACGLPIVTSRSGGITDYSQNGKTGFNYDYFDIDGIADGIKQLAHDNALRAEMAQYNQQVVLSYDVQNIVQIFNNLYNGE